MIYYKVINNQKEYFESDLRIDPNDATLANDTEILEYKLQQAKQAKIAELKTFHDSPTVKTITINGVYKVSMLSDQRMLLSEQITSMENQVKFAELQGETLDINTLVWNFKLENNGFISLNYLTLVVILTNIMAITNQNFTTRQLHIDAINALTTIDEVNDYDFTANYIINKNINLA